ncbi:UNVERIFIED_CONTAM: hypothetical protein PYX00_002563 [Menopon gallinae]|uniref:Uncharacterized protein n=1 Tax=Menopon gallinae TaxID=328185 RepID=A0AAW2IIL8_9NEOP
MSRNKIFKRVLIPCAAGLTAEKHTYGPNCVKKAEVKPSSLPIYSDECSVCGHSEKKENPPNQVEEAIGNVRRELWVWQDNMKGYRQKFVDVYKDGFERMDCPGGVVPERCVDRNHLEHSLDESCYPLIPCPDTKPPKTKEVKDFKCYKPSWPIGKKPKKVCVERCRKPPPKKEQTCSCCQDRIPACGRRS